MYNYVLPPLVFILIMLQIIEINIIPVFIVHTKVSIAAVKFIPYFTGTSEKLQLQFHWLEFM